MAVVNPYLLAGTLNVNRLIYPIKRQRMSECIKQNPTKCCLQKIHFSIKGTHILRVMIGWNEMF